LLKSTPVKAFANAGSARISGEVELWHLPFNHLRSENLRRETNMVYGIPSAVADGKRVARSVYVPGVDARTV